MHLFCTTVKISQGHLRTEQRVDDMLHSQMSQVRIGLAAAYEQDRLARNVGHGQSRADLIVL